MTLDPKLRPAISKPRSASGRTQKARRAHTRNTTQRRAWMGSPSTFKEFTFSSTANRHIVNSQEWAADCPAPNVFKRVHMRDRSEARLARQERAVQKAKELRDIVKENGWIKTPCPLDWVPKIPDYESEGDPCCPYTHSKCFKKHSKKMARAERRSLVKQRKQQQ